MNAYVFLAYTLFWLIFMAYVWNLARRQARLKKDIEELKSKYSAASPGPPPTA